MSMYLVAGGILVAMVLAGKFFKSFRRSASDTVLVHLIFKLQKLRKKAAKAEQSVFRFRALSQESEFKAGSRAQGTNHDLRIVTHMAGQ